jgi:hypothetical protein
MVVALLVVLPRPDIWAVALAGFLIRGGLLFFLLPIVVVPSPVGIANIVAPTLTTLVLGGVSPALAAAIAAIGLAVLLWLLVGWWLAAATERDIIEFVAADEEAVPHPPARPAAVRRGAWQIVFARLTAAVPLAAALLWGSILVVQATYAELTGPSDVTVPIALRVIAAVPEAVALIVGAWILSEVIGALAARRLVLRGESLDSAFFGAWIDLLRRPVGSVVTFIVPTLALVLTAAPSLVAAGIAWDGIRTVMSLGQPGDAPRLVLGLLVFLSVWGVGLALTGLVAAWRNAVWTVEVLRPRRTFGASVRRRPGDSDDGGTSESL